MSGRPALETVTPIRILSLGAGVQSSTIALMAAHGDIEPVDHAIFADTQAEPDSVYRWLDWLEKRLPFPVHRVTKGSLEKDALLPRITKDGRRYSKTNVPWYTLDMKTGAVGKVPMRTCTRDFKILPIIKQCRKLASVPRGCKEVRVIELIGISLDEVQRMKPSREPWMKHVWPLVEKRMTRRHCLEWMQAHGYPQPPRSACYFCPFHSAEEWRRLQVEEAVQFEKAASANFIAKPFLHRSCRPLDTIDFRSDVEKGQLTMWNEECEGMCGV